MDNWVAYKTLLRKEVYRIFRIWIQTFLAPIVTILLYFFIFGTLLGRHMRSFSADISYIEFIAPGLIAMAIIMNSYINASTSLFQAKFQRSIEELLVAPVPDWIIILGYVTSSMIRGIITAGLLLLVALFILEIQFYSILLFVLIVLLSSFFFASAGFVNALYAKNFDETAWIAIFVITPMTYLGGVFYSIKTLPQNWQIISQFNPIHYIVDVFRFSMIGFADADYKLSLLFLVASNVFIYLLALFLIKTKKNNKT